MPTKISLSLEQYKLLDNAYHFFNVKLFDNKLPECMIVLHRKKNSRGYFHAERYIEKVNKVNKKKKSTKSIDELALNPDDFNRPDIAILSTLVHEMAHVWRHRCADKKPSRGGYHDKLWANKMEEIGLMPSTTGREGGKKTGQRVTHYIVQDGEFETHCLKFLKGKAIKLSSFEMLTSSRESNKNKVKYSCPSCDLNIWAKPNVHVNCGDCDERLVEE
jgi:hypothetical protein